MNACPQCDSERLLTTHYAEHLPYGSENDPAIIVFVRPVRRCLNCQFLFSDEAGERAQVEALTKYRRTLAPAKAIDPWVKKNLHMLEHLSPGDIVRAWLHHLEAVDAGEGIEPSTSGV